MTPLNLPESSSEKWKMKGSRIFLALSFGCSALAPAQSPTVNLDKLCTDTNKIQKINDPTTAQQCLNPTNSIGEGALKSDAPETPRGSKLVVKIVGITPIIGSLRIKVCDNANCYKSDGSDKFPYYNETRSDLPLHKPVTKSEDEFVLENLPPGEYSVWIHHDRDNDGTAKTKTNLLGQPKDGLGWSQGASPLDHYRRPNWSEVKVPVRAGQDAEQTIKFIYMRD